MNYRKGNAVTTSFKLNHIPEQDRGYSNLYKAHHNIKLTKRDEKLLTSSNSLQLTSTGKMAQRVVENQDSIENEEIFIAETARLAELVVKQVALKSESCKLNA